jgi:hypothetical protein
MRGGATGRTGLFWMLVGASLLVSLGSVPYLVSLLAQIPGEGGRRFEIRGAFPYLLTAIQNLLLTIPTAWVGLRLAPRAGLAMVKPPVGRAMRIGVLGGLAVAGGLVLLAPLLPEITPRFPLRPAEWWKGLLASASAGVNEEIWFRLGVMTALVAAGLAVVRRRVPGAAEVEGAGGEDVSAAAVSGEAASAGAASAGAASAGAASAGAASQAAAVHAPAWILWPANAIAALLFGALHLPQAALIAGLSPPVVAFTLIGNGIAGLAFGWLYWKHGLVSAIAAHFSTDIVLHVIAPLAGP